jgi:hypothetical protein
MKTFMGLEWLLHLVLNLVLNGGEYLVLFFCICRIRGLVGHRGNLENILRKSLDHVGNQNTLFSVVRPLK